MAQHTALEMCDCFSYGGNGGEVAMFITVAGIVAVCNVVNTDSQARGRCPVRRQFLCALVGLVTCQVVYAFSSVF